MSGTHTVTAGFRGEAALMLRVIVSLILCETKTRFGKHRLGYVWALLEPAIFILGFIALRAYLSQSIPFGESLLLFMVPGLLVVRIFQGITGRMLPAISSNKALLSYPPVKPFDVLAARFVLELLTKYVLLVIFFVLMDWTADTEVILHYTRFASAVAALTVLACGVGAFNAVISVLWPTWSIIWGFTSFPLIILSGIFFVPKSLPPDAQYILSFNPVMHCVEWLRTATYLTYDPVLERTYPIAFGLIALVIALSLERIYRYRLLSE